MAMQPFTALDAVAAPMPTPNIDTDQILPARFLKKPLGAGYDKYGFADLRFDAAGGEKPDFVLNKAPYRGAGIIVAARNFATGSSREAAVYALLALGVRCVIAPSFGDIFYSNSTKNGLLPVILPEEQVNRLLALLAEKPGTKLAVDLAAQSVTGPGDLAFRFEIDASRKMRLLEGLDDIQLTLKYRPEIEAFERAYAAAPFGT